MFLLNWLKERQFCRFVCPCIWVKFDLLGTNKWPSASLRSECHLRFHVLPRLQNHFWLTKESNRQWEVGNGCEERKRLETGLSDRCRDQGDGQSDGGWKQEEPATKQTDISENRVTEEECWQWEETSEWQRLRDKWLEAGRRSVSACSLPPLHPSTSFFNRKRLRHHFIYYSDQSITLSAVTW